ncbi:MAG: PAS domain-containing sensor histidine kinase, partial [Ignavibacteriaceae bacterium]
MKENRKKSGKKVIVESNLFSKENIFTNLADSAPFMIWMADAKGSIFYFNKLWLNFTGKTIEQEKGEGWTKSIHPEDLDYCYSTYKTNFDARKEYVMEYRLRRHDNEYHWILEKGVPYFDENGDFSGFMGSCFDFNSVKKAEETLRENEELHKNLVESLTEGVIISDLYDRIIFANKRLCEMTGFSLEEIIGNYAYNLFFARKDWGKVLQKTKLRYSGVSDRYEIKVQKKDGNSFWVNISGSPYKNSKGEIIGTIGALSDISENKEARKILEMSEKKYRSVVEQVREVIFQTDAEGSISFINPFWTEITGYPYEETIGKNLLDYVHPEERKYCVDQFVNIIYQKKPFIRFITRFKTKKNEYRWVEVNARMSYDENKNILGTSGTVSDVHEIKLTEKELIIAKEKAEESDRLKSTFLAQVSHEIRSPLNIILSYNYMIREELKERMDNEFEDAFEAINHSGKRLLRTIDLILNMSLLQTGKQEINIRSLDLNPLLKNLVNEFTSTAKRKNIELKFDVVIGLPEVKADEYTIT